MSNSDCLIYPIMQKYYSALNNLKELNIEDDLFLNISKVDAFFAEFRNITFVMQKVFNTNELQEYYKIKRDEFLLKEDMKWFVDQRNKVTKQAPFKLEKAIVVDVYFPDKSFTILDDNLTLDNEIPFESMKEIVKNYLLKYQKYTDIYFCISLSFKENNAEINIYKKIKNGLLIMDNFIGNLMNDYPCDCIKCIKMKQKLKDDFSYVLNKEMTFIWDFTLKDNKIVNGAREMLLPGGLAPDFSNIKSVSTKLSNSPLFKNAPDNLSALFEMFISMHTFLYQQQKHSIMPTFMLIFKDKTFSLFSFNGSLKTTYYRTASRVAKLSRENDVVAIFYVGEYYFCSIDDLKSATGTLEERKQSTQKTLLSFSRIDNKNSQILSINMEASKLHEKNYIAQKISHPEETELLTWLNPIHQSLHLQN